jgi:hypothetical protein
MYKPYKMVLYDSQSEQQLFPKTALTTWSFSLLWGAFFEVRKQCLNITETSFGLEELIEYTRKPLMCKSF